MSDDPSKRGFNPDDYRAAVTAGKYSNPETHTCQCGHTWKHGAHGGHSCSTYYQATIEKLENRIKTLES